MTWILIAFFLVGLIAGLVGGYLLAVSRTDRTIAAMDDDEINALAARVRARKAR